MCIRDSDRIVFPSPTSVQRKRADRTKVKLRRHRGSRTAGGAHSGGTVRVCAWLPLAAGRRRSGWLRAGFYRACAVSYTHLDVYKRQQLLLVMDTNKSGKVSREEWMKFMEVELSLIHIYLSIQSD